MLATYLCICCWFERRCSATSLISCALILIVTLQQRQHVAAAVVPSTRAATTTPTRQTTKGFANPAKYGEATRNYYRTRATNNHEQVPNAATYGNYFAGESAASETGAYGRGRGAELPGALIRRDNLAGLYEAPNPTDFTPTSLTAAGQHYAAAITAASTDEEYALLLGEAFKSAAGDKIDYEERNAENYEAANEGSMETERERASSGSYEAIKHELRHQQQYDSTSEHQTGRDEAEQYDDFPYDLENEPHSRDYQRQTSFPDFQQHPGTTFGHELAPSSDVFKANYAEDPDGQQESQHLKARESDTHQRPQRHQHQFHFSDHRQQTMASSQPQVQITDSTGRSIRHTYADHTASRDSARPSALYDNQHHGEHQVSSNHLDSNLQHMQHQLQQQQQQFAQLQQQLQQHDIQLQHQQHLATREALHQAHVRPPLPPITTTVHHTPASAAAVSGIPLAKHVHVAKHVPTLAHYQQQHVPYKQNVPIEIPHPIITTVPRPYPISIPISKTVAIQQLKEVKIPIEKIKPFPVERSVPYIVERRVPYRVEKQVAAPYYYPYPIKVPVVKTIVHRAPASSHHHQPHRQHLHHSSPGFS